MASDGRGNRDNFVNFGDSYRASLNLLDCFQSAAKVRDAADLCSLCRFQSK